MMSPRLILTNLYLIYHLLRHRRIESRGFGYAHSAARVPTYPATTTPSRSPLPPFFFAPLSATPFFSPHHLSSACLTPFHFLSPLPSLLSPFCSSSQTRKQAGAVTCRPAQPSDAGQVIRNTLSLRIGSSRARALAVQVSKLLLHKFYFFYMFCFVFACVSFPQQRETKIGVPFHSTHPPPGAMTYQMAKRDQS
ncbi:hypothetical protein F4775DRAFT_211473 [Biscogniauxia sp. FL1348]|nr:hypothetical protein F4775DRAFT_211473 [Biscogniauxia sp. FL1348]